MKQFNNQTQQFNVDNQSMAFGKSPSLFPAHIYPKMCPRNYQTAMLSERATLKNNQRPIIIY